MQSPSPRPNPRPSCPHSLEILSLGRNNIKKIEGLDGVADTLKELWMSYNSVEKLAGVEKLKALEILFLCVAVSS